MTDTSSTQAPVRRHGADADDTGDGEFHIEEFINSLLFTRVGLPSTVHLVLNTPLLGESLTEKTGDSSEPDDSDGEAWPEIHIEIAITHLAQVWSRHGPIPDDGPPPLGHKTDPYYLAPEFEATGWLVAHPGLPADGERVWVRCALRTGADATIRECVVYLLAPDEVPSTDWTPGMG